MCSQSPPSIPRQPPKRNRPNGLPAGTDDRVHLPARLLAVGLGLSAFRAEEHDRRHALQVVVLVLGRQLGPVRLPAARRSASASEGSHFRLTARGGAASRERANIFPATLNTEVSGPNGKVSAAPANEKQ